MTQEPPRGPQPPQSPQSPQSPPSAPPPQQQYGPPPGPPAGGQPGNGIALAAMVVGIVAVVFGTILGFFLVTAILAIIMGILAIIFGVIGRRRADANPAIGRRGMGTAGLVLGIIALIGGLAWSVLFAAVIEDADDDLDQLNEELEQLEEQSTTP